MNGVTAFLIFVILPIALYVLSLKLNPWVKCSRCKNQPRRRVGEHLRSPHLPQMQGHRATTSVWPEFHLRGAGAPRQTLMLWLSVGFAQVCAPLLSCFTTRRHAFAPHLCARRQQESGACHLGSGGVGTEGGASAEEDGAS